MRSKNRVAALVLLVACSSKPPGIGPTPPLKNAAGAMDRVVEVVAGFGHHCVVLDRGAVRCWGFNWDGQLGYGHRDNIGDDETLEGLGDLELPEPTKHVALGEKHTCALGESGIVRCWGSNEMASLGVPGAARVENAKDAAIVQLGGKAIAIDSGGDTCALMEDNTIRCWGLNSHGELGYGHKRRIGDDEEPRSEMAIDVGGKTVQMDVGPSRACVVSSEGQVRCWGSGTDGSLGYGKGKDDIGDDERADSLPVLDLGGPVKQVDVGAGHACAVMATNHVRCWGSNDNGELGYGNTNRIGDDEKAGAGGDVALVADAVHVEAGFVHSCALLVDGRVQCWGHNVHGQLGLGHKNDIGDDETPLHSVVDIGGKAKALTIGDSTTCVLMENGGVRCWGDNSFGFGYAHTRTIGDDETPASQGDLALPH
jgi:alpha-tubulin suppressor-like RCC1 family protein